VAQDGQPIIRTRALTKTYPGGIEAVKAVDLEVRSGEIYGLLGPNGAGKSTTIGMLTTRVVPTSGDAEVGGVDIVRHPALAKQVIGVVPQSNTLDRAMTVSENLEFHGRYFGMSTKVARAAARELLATVRLAERADAPVAALSGGMAQRLMVARAILHRPQILFLDEPTAGLDPQSRIALWEILEVFHEQGQTILLTTHYMEEADQLCDRVAIMDHGSILALDTPMALKKSIGAERVVTVSASGDVEGLAAKVLSDVPAVSATKFIDGRLVLEADGRPGLLPALIAVADGVDVTIHDVQVAEPSLETVFINLTGKDLRE
jgi:ABC-2 type transport system ATP-binding protein